MESDEKTLQKLEPLAIFGFDGKMPGGIKVHPGGKHIIFAIGNKISVMNIQTDGQEFLSGHTNTISAFDVAPTGQLLASGQVSHMGFRSSVILWDWETRKERARYDLHRVRVESVRFTGSERFLVSLGGADCGMIIVWDVEKGTAICGASAARETTGAALRLEALRFRGDAFVSIGQQTLRLWTIDPEARRLKASDVNVGKLRRDYTAARVDENDEILLVGTMSGDVVKVKLNLPDDPDKGAAPTLLGCYARHNPRKSRGQDCSRYSNGVRELWLFNDGKILIGGGDGTVDLVQERNVSFRNYQNPTWPQYKSLQRTKVNGPISSFQQLNAETILIGTEACEIYSLSLGNFDVKLLKTCHTGPVFDVAFPHNFSGVFATASFESLRIWSVRRMQELLRIVVPNFTASGVVFSHDGKSLLSAWNDGALRAFTPLTGRLAFAIPNAHNKGCSALAAAALGGLLVSGGLEGQVRVWSVARTPTLLGVLKEHTAAVTSVDFNRFDTEVVSASRDGSCIIWDIINFSRKHVLLANTQFTCARYLPSGIQILATGSDRRITYWEVFDASLVRDVEGSLRGSINSLSFAGTGDFFASAGSDQLLRFWDYNLGLPVGLGRGHSAEILVVTCSPCGGFIVTGSADGAVFVWSIPEQFRTVPTPSEATPKAAPQGKSRGRMEKMRENISQLNGKNSGKKLQISECPPIDDRRSGSGSSKSSKSSKGSKNGGRISSK
ncbi:cilia- and flagella-associated protein 52 [Lutzomyia longipalpis]|uniref:cilia- and flagella-associated protein 52 n=1 Tax=Lutzomyia longipalpis TaxID=7200 RepID=UPI0024833486|nr:cilia- and flagella-associated protein 52 [Lutzomyia longipalpis]